MDNNHLKHTDKTEDVDIANQFKDLPVGKLISGPLKAVVDAQKNMAEYAFKALTDKKNQVRENTKTNNK